MTLRILYNGACPICAREIAHYRRLATGCGAAIAFDDLTTADLSPWGLTADAARRRLHARDGTVRLAGLAAFRALWARLPGWRWLARLTGLPGVQALADWAYERIAAPWLYRRSCRAEGCRVA
jgi:predicted DCC family thiol-disulfide oxidoreductase YuxK